MQYVYCGLDWGFSVDPFAFVRLSYDRKTDTVYLLDELYQKNCSNARIAELIKEKGYHLSGKLSPGGVMYSPYAEQQTIFADAAEPKSIADLRGAGLKIYPCKKYPGSVIYGIRWLQNRKIVIDPKRTPHAWKEFTEYEYLTTKDGEFLADVPDENNHILDACRYALDRLINNRGVSA